MLFDSPLIQKLSDSIGHCFTAWRAPNRLTPKTKATPGDAHLNPGSFALSASSTSVPAYICSYTGEGKRSIPAKGEVGEGDLRCLLQDT